MNGKFKKKIYFTIFRNKRSNKKGKDESERMYERSQKTLMYDDRLLEENDDEELQCYDGEDASCAESDTDDMDKTKHYSRINKLKGFRKNVSQYRLDTQVTPKGEEKRKEEKKVRESRVKAYKHVYENQSEDETMQGKQVNKKCSNQVEEMSDHSENMSEKPAMNTLKKTFTSMLSKLQLGRSHADDSYVGDDCRLADRTYNTNDNKVLDKKKTGSNFC
jgi:hypothetical protein